MKKVTPNVFTLTDKEIQKIKKDFDRNVNDLLSQRYDVSLPLHAIKILLETCITDVRNFDVMSNQGYSFSAREGLNAQAKQQIVYVLAGELKKHKYDWKQLFIEIIKEVKRKEKMR